MSPRMEADFNWADDVKATTPVHDKGEYELTILRVRGRAWYKKDPQGNLTKEITKVVSLAPKMVGKYGSDGKLDTLELNDTERACEDINLWVHSDGGRKMSKQQMMAICGYNPQDPKEEDNFNDFLRTSQLDLSSKVEESEEDDGKLSLVIGEGWEKLLKGKNVRALMDKEIRKIEGRDDVEQQNYKQLSPVNKDAKKATSQKTVSQSPGAAAASRR